MAFEILYYDRSMAQRLPECDTVGDAAFGVYPAPTDPTEVAQATCIEDRSRVMYGYDGDWHRSPPAACLAREAQERNEAAAARGNAERALQRQLPHAVAADGASITVRMPDGAQQTLTWPDLHHAARQSDRDLAAVYSQIEQEALRLINR